MLRIFTRLLVAVCVSQVAAQTDTLIQAEARTAELMESQLQRQEDASVEDFNTMPEVWEDYLRKPLHINRAGAEELRESGLFNEFQVAGLLAHRENTGPIISIIELQTIPGFTPEDIRKVMPFLTTGGNLDDYQLSLPKMLTESQHTLFLRWSAIMEKQRGFDASEVEHSRFRGNPHHYYMRYRQT